MAKCAIYAKGEKVGEIVFSSFPPDTEATVYDGAGAITGTISSRHAIGEGAVHNTSGAKIGEVSGNALHEEPCIVHNSSGDLVGGTIGATQIGKGSSPVPEKWMLVGTIRLESWTNADDVSIGCKST